MEGGQQERFVVVGDLIVDDIQEKDRHASSTRRSTVTSDCSSCYCNFECVSDIKNDNKQRHPQTQLYNNIRLALIRS